MANIYLGNIQLGGGGITPTNTLPTANAENYDKHELYLNGGELHYLNEEIKDTNTWNGTYYQAPTGYDKSVTNYAIVDGKIYFNLSGKTTIEMFDIDSKTITTMATAIDSGYIVYVGEAQVDGDFIYFRDSFSAIKYNYKDNTYTKYSLGTSPSYAQLNCGSAIYNGYFYTFGGRGRNGVDIGYIYKYNMSNNFSKSRVGSLVITNGYATKTTKIGNIVYIFVAEGSASDFYGNEIWKFDLTNETLTKLTTTLLNGRYSFFATTQFYNKILIIGGNKQGSGTSYKGIQSFDVASETITQLTTSIVRKAGSFACVLGTKIYVGLGNNRNVGELTFDKAYEYKTLASSDVVNTISFTIGSTSYQAIDGMTWEQWVASAYNTNGWQVSNTRIINDTQTRYVVYAGVEIAKTDEIVADRAYTTASGGGGGNND